MWEAAGLRVHAQALDGGDALQRLSGWVPACEGHDSLERVLKRLVGGDSAFGPPADEGSVKAERTEAQFSRVVHTSPDHRVV